MCNNKIHKTPVHSRVVFSRYWNCTEIDAIFCLHKFYIYNLNWLSSQEALKNAHFTILWLSVHISDWLRLQSQDLPNENEIWKPNKGTSMNLYVCNISVISQIEALKHTWVTVSHEISNFEEKTAVLVFSPYLTSSAQSPRTTLLQHLHQLHWLCSVCCKVIVASLLDNRVLYTW